MDIFWNLGWFFKRHWLRYLGCVVCLVMIALVELYPPRLVGELVDAIQSGSFTSDILAETVGLIVAVGVAVFILRNGWRLLLFGGALELGRVIRLRLFHHLTRMSPGFYQRHKTGDLMAHATNDIRSVEASAAEGVLTLVDSVVAGTAVVGAMIWVCGWEMTVVALLPFPVMAFLISRYSAQLHKRFRESQEAFSNLNNRVQESVSGIRAVRAHYLGSAQMDRFAKQSNVVTETNMKVARVDALFDPTISMTVAFSMLGSLGFGAWRIQHGAMSVGELTTFVVYLSMMIWPMFAFGWLFNIVERGSASLKRINKLLAEQPDVKDNAADNQERLDGDIRFVSQGFEYPGSGTAALKEFDLTIRKGSFVGISGRTGGGKTSLLRLLLRQHDAKGVEVTIGGQRNDSVSLDALHSRFALVAQEPFLFSASISENIAFGKPGATQEEIEEVARLACIHDDILNFKDGYETQLGEKGVNLSGGQKQRITIARALLIDADYLLLDDAFCSLDMKTEAFILDQLLNSNRPRTLILITQRLTNLQLADQVVVMDKGEITEQGSHKALLAQQGWYANIFKRQANAIAAGLDPEAADLEGMKQVAHINGAASDAK
ncbi:ABC transporter transmembrane domain-containing protein [Parendozoicomonas haliclonae]|uniref:Multidrug resistance-like ATP-binding protein MdlA n=1 Tax=Parendozoicomonas haliclonae TaxID=1960125 RepID=A0A1X7AI42_9GAMM|nr:ABC transporter transmembrane domain-containing protein [Parendozoicomonas haliclonae]SMA44106.1 putative multidrug resistance ABC transporter ATP-binding/permease protein YheI [Parendozoicomonas haliclonae]